MGQQVKDIMSKNPCTVTASDSVADAARMMKEKDIGPVIVLKEGGEVCGIVTDRDIAIRAVAEGKDPRNTRVDEICSHDLTTVEPGADAEKAVRMMREKAIRRLPVVENGTPVGIVSLGDLAMEKDPQSALADISAAPPNE